MTTLPAPEWTESQLLQLCRVAEAAGAAILGIYARLATEGPAGTGVGLQHKADDSPLTEADLLADRIIRTQLGVHFTGHAVLSEEDDAPADAKGATGAINGIDAIDAAAGYFLVDPLDGTKEFLARNGEFTVNIAWVQAGRVRAGVVHLPALGESFWGAAGRGAWKADRQGAARPIRVAAPPTEGQLLRVLASRSHGGAVQRAYLQRLPQPIRCVEAGSSLKFCRLAEGAADLYPRLTATMAWDTAAGQAVLEAAGGVVLGTEGLPLPVPGRPRAAPNPPFIAASSAGLAQRAVAVL